MDSRRARLDTGRRVRSVRVECFRQKSQGVGGLHISGRTGGIVLRGTASGLWSWGIETLQWLGEFRKPLIATAAHAHKAGHIGKYQAQLQLLQTLESL